MSMNSAIKLFAEKLVKDLRENLKKKLAAKSKNGHSGDSRLGASIKIEYYTTGDIVLGFALFMNDYFYFVNAGRKAGKGISKEGQVSLARWVKTRGLQPSLTDVRKKRIKSVKNKQVRKAYKKLSEEAQIKKVVYAISKKIKEKGYEANHFFDEVINDGRVERFQEYMDRQYNIDLQLQLKKWSDGDFTT